MPIQVELKVIFVFHSLLIIIFSLIHIFLKIFFNLNLLKSVIKNFFFEIILIIP